LINLTFPVALAAAVVLRGAQSELTSRRKLLQFEEMRRELAGHRPIAKSLACTACNGDSDPK
jgi:hypothetical protein